MASNGRANNPNHEDSNHTNPDTSAAEAALKARLSRKRTKTGCLTCRKRRIKCGEERPVCKNCMKSKRQCEGYTQRVVFKQPSFDYPPISNEGANITFQAGPSPGPLVPYDHDYGQVIFDPSFYAQHQLRPTEQYAHPFPSAAQQFASAEQQQLYRASRAGFQRGGLSYQPEYGANSTGANQGVNGTENTPSRNPGQGSSEVQPAPGRTPTEPSKHTLQPPPLAPVVTGSGPNQYPPDWQQPLKRKREEPGPQISSTTSPTRASPSSSISSQHLTWSQSSTAENWNPPAASLSHVPPPELPRSIGLPPPPIITSKISEPVTVSVAPAVQPHDQFPSEYYEHTQNLPVTNSTNNFLSQAAVESVDDDYYDVDEEMGIDTLAETMSDHERQRNLQRILQDNDISIQDLHTRQYDTFLYEGILDRYRVEDAANPLKNPATARVFAHFISVTAPSLSIFERHPRNTSVLFTDGQIPYSQRGLWTYTMPVAALHHQGLLHSMLALASLHIARLQNASDTPSRQHYAWACKRINHLLGPKSKKRHKTTTIAASMLLGFYEVFTADHRAWNLHLTGSKQLFLETDFITLASQFRRLKRERANRQAIAADLPSAWSSYFQSQDEILDQIHDVDESVVSRLVGSQVNYEGNDQVMTPHSGRPGDFDLNTFEILRDLYWWYLKQDAYQSIISGNPLLLDYSRWANCPPRAPIGRPDAVYGTFDHLVLLLGRVAEFSSRDRKRKLRQMEASGGQWKPPPGAKMPQTPNQHRSQPTTPLSATNGHPTAADYFAVPSAQIPVPPPQPAFYGMAPPPRSNVQMPSAYNPGPNIPTPAPTSPGEELDLRAATIAALEEYGRIRAALREFESSLGEAFEPLSPEYQVPLETPFGSALFFRSYDIACLWTLYYMAVMIAIRSHPHMHPAAHAAAAMTAQETSFYATEIGRITAGILPGPPDQPLNPTLGAALWESCIPSFFAAIQYKTPQQRHATVTRIHNIGVRTGWGTAETIANGCETAWVKAAEAGRGPPYTRIARQDYSEDPRLSGRLDGVDQHIIRNGKNEKDQRLVKTKADARLTWAMGILGMEEDEPAKGAG